MKPSAILRSIYGQSSAICWVMAIATLVLGAGSASAHDMAAELHDAAKLFLNSLEPAAKQKATFEFDDELRMDWQFIPMERQGISFKEMKPNQRWLALGLLQTALSHRGFSQSMQVMSLEQILHELENNSPKRDPEKYHLFFFGAPSNESTWGWRVEGHHLSLSFTIVDGKTVVSTPSFFGSNPAEVRNGPHKGLRVLGDSEDLGRQLIKSLSAEQKEIAIVSEVAPHDVINGPGRAASEIKPLGIPAADMTSAQRENLMAIVRCFVGKVRPELAASDLQKIEDAGLDKIHFAWAGKIKPGQPHYYRVQGPTFILEYDNTQNDANHVHTVWRDFENDFGADLLKKHYEAKPHDSATNQ
jgi:hypothetical protein